MRIDAVLTHASRETLLMVIAELRETIPRTAGDASGIRRDGSCPAASLGACRATSRRPAAVSRMSLMSESRASNGSAALPASAWNPPDERCTLPESCPECGTGLAGGWVQRTREVVDVPPTPVEVTEHVLLARRCPTCERRRVPRLALDGVAVGRQRLGVGLMSLIATLREEERLPVRTIQSHLWTVYQLKLSAGAIVEAIHRVARGARPAVADMPERIRGSPVVHADETGRREGGATATSGRSALPGSATSSVAVAARRS